MSEMLEIVQLDRLENYNREWVNVYCLVGDDYLYYGGWVFDTKEDAQEHAHNTIERNRVFRTMIEEGEYVERGEIIFAYQMPVNDND